VKISLFFIFIGLRPKHKKLSDFPRELADEALKSILSQLKKKPIYLDRLKKTIDITS
jgi:hypothetical protein